MGLLIIRQKQPHKFQKKTQKKRRFILLPELQNLNFFFLNTANSIAVPKLETNDSIATHEIITKMTAIYKQM